MKIKTISRLWAAFCFADVHRQIVFYTHRQIVQFDAQNEEKKAKTDPFRRYLQIVRLNFVKNSQLNTAPFFLTALLLKGIIIL